MKEEWTVRRRIRCNGHNPTFRRPICKEELNLSPFTFNDWTKKDPLPLGAVACYRPGGKFHGALLQDFDVLVFLIFDSPS